MMEILKSVPLHDWAALLFGVLGAAAAFVQRSGRLPAAARRWLKAVGEHRIEAAVAYAAGLAGLTPDERRAEAAALVVKICDREFGVALPDSVANLLVEYVYQRWKASQSR